MRIQLVPLGSVGIAAKRVGANILSIVYGPDKFIENLLAASPALLAYDLPLVPWNEDLLSFMQEKEP